MWHTFHEKPFHDHVYDEDIHEEEVDMEKIVPDGHIGSPHLTDEIRWIIIRLEQFQTRVMSKFTTIKSEVTTIRSEFAEVK